MMEWFLIIYSIFKATGILKLAHSPTQPAQDLFANTLRLTTRETDLKPFVLGPPETLKKTPWPLVRKRTIPTERPPHVRS
jgi:hypothetical protein